MKENKIKVEYGDKSFTETHYCPICDKKAVDYFLEFFKKNNYFEIMDIDNVSWWWVDDDTPFIIEFGGDEDGNYIDEDEIISFELEDFGLKTPDKLFKTLFDEYQKKYNCGNRHPYFCSSKCCKKFILSKFKP